LAAPGSLHGPAPSCPGAAPPAAGGVLPRRLVEAAHGLPKADGGRADQGGGILSHLGRIWFLKCRNHLSRKKSRYWTKWGMGGEVNLAYIWWDSEEQQCGVGLI